LKLPRVGAPDELLALGRRIGQLRRAGGWTQRRLAESAGVSHGYIALLEHGRLASPGKFRLDAVARCLGASSADALLDPTPPADLSPPADYPAPAPRRLARFWPAEPCLLPVYLWGSRGDPRDPERPPDPNHLEPPPVGRETLVGPNGFGVLVKGDSLSGRGIRDGDIGWVNPDRPIHLGKVVLALDPSAGLMLGTYLGDTLISESDPGPVRLATQTFTPIGPVVGIASWRPPR
jgi:transcriptional regulator with XRE-family HTH domain